jgi:hypothetical protein
VNKNEGTKKHHSPTFSTSSTCRNFKLEEEILSFNSVKNAGPEFSSVSREGSLIFKVDFVSSLLLYESLERFLFVLMIGGGAGAEGISVPTAYDIIIVS